MRIEHHRWYSPRLGWDMGVAVFGHWGPPMLAFPTSHGDEWELQRQGLLDAIADFIDGGRLKVFCVGSNNHDSFLNKGAHPFHRSWRQRMFDEYIRDEVIPFIHSHCQSPGIPITTFGASLGAYHAANTLLRYPHLVKRCYAFSGVYDLRRFMDGMYDDNFYFHNPIDYAANLSDPWFLDQLASCELRMVTGSGPWEDSRPTYAFSSVLHRKGIRHYVDDWGQKGGHDWPYWKEMIREYVSRW
jgi:esterase/lipase superfamily enzyme